MKKVLSITFMLLLPFGAMADVGPAEFTGNGAPVIADNIPPYATVEITNDDMAHIASTAYVKGAYNDTIAAMNAIGSAVDELADRPSTQLIDSNGQTINSANVRGVMADFSSRGNGENNNIVTYGGLKETLRYTRVPLYTTWGADNISSDVGLLLPETHFEQ